MSDEIDDAQTRELADTARALAAARETARRIPVGAPGDCDFCGEWSGRLVEGACAPCRDKRRLK